MHIGGVYLGELFKYAVCLVFNNAGCSLNVGSEIAPGANGNAVLSYGSEKHIFVADAAAHHTRVGLDGYNLGNTAAGKNTVVSVVASPVVCFKVFLRCVEGVSVLHCEFTHTDKTCSGSALVTEFGLNLVNHKGIFLVAVGVFTNKVNCSLLVSHTEHKGSLVSVSEAYHFTADGSVSARFLPHRCGHNNGELYLLTVNSIHLFSYYLLNLLGNSAKSGVRGVNSVCNVFDVSASDCKCVAVNNTVRRSFFESLSYKLVKFHICFTSE